MQGRHRAPGPGPSRGIVFIKKQNLNQENKVIKFLLGTAGRVESGLVRLTGHRSPRPPCGAATGQRHGRGPAAPPKGEDGVGPPGLGSEKVGTKPGGLSGPSWNRQAEPQARAGPGSPGCVWGQGPQICPARYCGGLATPHKINRGSSWGRGKWCRGAAGQLGGPGQDPAGQAGVCERLASPDSPSHLTLGLEEMGPDPPHTWGLGRVRAARGVSPEPYCGETVGEGGSGETPFSWAPRGASPA